MRDLLTTLHYLLTGLSAGFTVTYAAYAAQYTLRPTPEHPLQLTWLLSASLICAVLTITTQRLHTRLT